MSRTTRPSPSPPLIMKNHLAKVEKISVEARAHSKVVAPSAACNGNRAGRLRDHHSLNIGQQRSASIVREIAWIATAKYDPERSITASNRPACAPVLSAVDRWSGRMIATKAP